MSWPTQGIKGLLILCCTTYSLNVAKAQPNDEWMLNPAANSNTSKADDFSRLDQEIKELQAELISFEERFTKNSRQLSLNAVVELALKNNPTLQASIDQVRSSEWLLTASQQSWYPVLSLNSSGIPSYGVNSTYSYGALTNEQQSTSRLEAGLNAQFGWTFLDPQRQPNINTSYYQLSADRLLFYTTARDTISNAQIGYYNLQGSIENIKNFQEIVSATQKSYNSIANKYKSGYANLLQVEQIRAQLELDLNNLISYYINYSQNAAQLSAYVGLPESTIITPSSPLAKERAWTEGLEQSIKLGLSNSERIQQALAQADQNKWQGYFELNTYLPKFTLSIASQANHGSLRQSSWGTYNNQYGTQNGNTYAFLGFQWQLFNGGIDYSKANSYFSLQQESLERSRAQSDLVASSVRSNFASMFGNSKAVNVTNRAYRSAQVANEAATMRYRAGLDDVTTIVQTVQLLGNSSISRTGAIVGYNTAISNLYRYAAIWPPNTYQLVEELLSPRETTIRQSALPELTGKAPSKQ